MSAHFSAGQRRALNQVWNGAGRYGFEPLFLSFCPDGSPNLYLNTVAGCAYRWYGQADALFARWAGDRRQALLDDLCWLALESAVYQRELPRRPLLADLRRDWASAFFDQEHSLSRQEWMAKNQLSYAMQAARWRAVLGRRPPVMTPYEKRLSAALDCDPLEEEALFREILDIFARFRLFTGRTRPPSALHLRLTGRLAGVMTRLAPAEIVHTDVVELGRTAPAGEGAGRATDPRRAKLSLREDAGADRRYIAACFGPSLLSDRELSMAEQALCTGVHLGCRLWYTAGVPNPQQAGTGEARRMAEQAQLQARRNREAFTADSALYQSAIRHLTEQIQNCLQVHGQTGRTTARSGQLDSSRVWRGAVLSDGRIFTRSSADPRPGFAVDLLLDASASRLHCQEILAAQGYILAESLRRCGIAVRVSGFCSLRGYTVLRVLKDFAGPSRNVFRYFASGWNRDGLALRAAGTLLRCPPEQRRLLLLLTDASPNDSFRIPPCKEYPFGRDYADAPAAEDAARQVRSLRLQGIQVGAIFMGPSASIPAAETIYGRSLARIRSMDQLAAGAGTLIQEAIRELEG